MPINPLGNGQHQVVADADEIRTVLRLFALGDGVIAIEPVLFYHGSILRRFGRVSNHVDHVVKAKAFADGQLAKDQIGKIGWDVQG